MQHKKLLLSDNYSDFLNSGDFEEKTPLHTALEHQLFTRAETLLEFGASKYDCNYGLMFM